MNVGDGSGNLETTSSLKGALKLLKESLVGKLEFKSLYDLTTLAEILSSPIKNLSLSYSHLEGALIFSFWHSLEVSHHLRCGFSFFLFPMSND